jgi:hypothetical protein
VSIAVRSVTIAAAICVSYACFALGCPQTAHDLGVDVWNLTEGQREQTEERLRKEKVERAGQVSRKRLHLKWLIAQDVVAGRTPLAVAADQYAALNEAEPELVTVMRQTCPAPTLRESAARQVILHAGNVLKERGSGRREILERLEAERSHPEFTVDSSAPSTRP